MPPHSSDNCVSNGYIGRDDSFEHTVDLQLALLRQPKLLRARSVSFPVMSSSIAGSSPTHQSLSSGSSSSVIRSRLLNRLGIVSKESELIVSRPHAEFSLLAKCPILPFEEALKADCGKFETSRWRDSVSIDKKGKGTVSFHPSVCVHMIPNRSVYSDRIRGSLWTHPLEMQQNVARNSLEFAAEGWDWTKVAEDEDMVICGGEQIHPVHFVQEISQYDHFDDLKSKSNDAQNSTED
jgi:hypothetical protein